MTADSKHAESLARIEHKLDIVLDILGVTRPDVRRLVPTIVGVGDSSHKCGLCLKQVEYFVDTIDSVVVRKCDCKTGKLAPVDLGAFSPPVLSGTRKEKENGNEEDRGDSDPRRRPGRG